MKRILFAVALALTAPATTLAQTSRAPAAERPVAVDRAVRPPVMVANAEGAPVTVGDDALAEPAPNAAPLPTEPKDWADLFTLLTIIALSVKTAANLGTLTAILAAALSITYALMFLSKQALKGNLPENYKTALRILLGVLTAIAAGIGFYLGGAPVAIAAGSGAAASGPFHDWLDGQRAKKT